MAYKFYFDLFENKKFVLADKFRWDKHGEERFLVKPGITHNRDALDRYNVNAYDGYTKSQKYLDWDISCKFSMWFSTKDQAREYEKYWLEKEWPNPGYTKVWIEKALNCPTDDYYTEATGVSELRLISERQLKRALRMMYEYRKEWYAKNGRLVLVPEGYVETDPGKMSQSYRDRELLDDDNAMTWSR